MLSCSICEQVTGRYMSFFRGDGDDQKVTFAVCYECVSVGIRWIVNQGRGVEEEPCEAVKRIMDVAPALCGGCQRKIGKALGA